MTDTGAERDLMQRIHDTCGAAIHSACTMSSIPESFLAALIANESGGNGDEKRFEPNVLVALWQVLLGRETHYFGIARAELLQFVGDGNGVTVPANLPADAFQRVDSLATSWGVTQIMGYNALALKKPIGYIQGIDGNLNVAISILTSFAQHWHLDVGKDFSDLFDCWNTGRPNGKTYDPMYIQNGLLRMQIYQSILTPPAETSEQENAT